MQTNATTFSKLIKKRIFQSKMKRTVPFAYSYFPSFTCAVSICVCFLLPFFGKQKYSTLSNIFVFPTEHNQRMKILIII